MPGSRGKQRSRDKRKRRRDVRKTSLAARQTSLAKRRAAKKQAELTAETVFDEETAAKLLVIGYDAAVGPADIDAWLALSDDTRHKAIEHYHQHHTPHETPRAPRLHAIAHLIVENQIAQNSIPEVAETLHRLTASGQPRHDAIHSIGSVMMAQLYEVSQAGKDPSVPAIIAALEALTAPPQNPTTTAQATSAPAKSARRARSGRRKR